MSTIPNPLLLTFYLSFERFTDAEHDLCIRRFHHHLSKEEREEKHRLMMEHSDLDIEWGFFDDGVKAAFKRWWYVTFIHWRHRKRKLMTRDQRVELLNALAAGVISELSGAPVSAEESVPEEPDDS